MFVARRQKRGSGAESLVPQIADSSLPTFSSNQGRERGRMHNSVMHVMFTVALAPSLLLWHLPFAIADILVDAPFNLLVNSKTEDFSVLDMDLPAAITKRSTASMIADDHPSAIARYSPGVVYRSNDFNEGNANLSTTAI
jgi:hypothetical protein